MKKDVVGMDRPRSEEELADLAWIRQSEVLSDLEQRVARLEALADKQAQFIAVQAERVARLEKYRVDYVQVCTRVAQLESLQDDTRTSYKDCFRRLTELENRLEALAMALDAADLLAGPLPWGDLD